MAVSIINQSSESITLQVTIPFTRSMLESETPSNQDDEIKGVLKKQIDAAIKEEPKLNRPKKAREQKQRSLAAAITYFTNNNEKSR